MYVNMKGITGIQPMPGFQSLGLYGPEFMKRTAHDNLAQLPLSRS